MAQFWGDVKDLLTRKHGHDDSRARKGIDEYKQEMARRGIWGVVYNQGEEQAAKVIDGVIRQGVPTPSTL